MSGNKASYGQSQSSAAPPAAAKGDDDYEPLHEYLLGMVLPFSHKPYNACTKCAVAAVILSLEAAILVGLIYFYYTQCTVNFAQVPNVAITVADTDPCPVVPAVQEILDQGRVTILDQNITAYLADQTITLLGTTIMQPIEWSCECAELATCNFRCCSMNLPLSVRYQLCNDVYTALGLALSYAAYGNMLICIAAVAVHNAYRAYFRPRPRAGLKEQEVA